MEKYIVLKYKMWGRLVGRFGGPFGGYRDDGSHMDGILGVFSKSVQNALKCGCHLRAVCGVKSSVGMAV